MQLGVYVHFPWCRRRCPYCDFAIAVAPLGEIPHERYADAVLAELAARAPRFPDRRLRSVYFGGGTPALWDPAALGRVLAAIVATFPREADGALEITVEANPNDCTPATLRALRAAGVNRLSIGAQAFADDELVTLGRDHDARMALAAVDVARAAGFERVSLDLIYGLPGRTAASWRRTLERAVAVAPDHLSVYQLTIEDRTTFGEAHRRGTLVPPPDDELAARFEEAHEALGAAGYEHYEVSSYARPGARARHNSAYWQGIEYLGLGSAAHSFHLPAPGRALRWSAHRSVVRYLAGRPASPETPIATDPLVASCEEQGEAELRADRLWLGMRTCDGVPRALLADRGPAVERLVAAGLAVVREERLVPTPRGLLLADEVGAMLLSL